MASIHFTLIFSWFIKDPVSDPRHSANVNCCTENKNANIRLCLPTHNSIISTIYEKKIHKYFLISTLASESIICKCCNHSLLQCTKLLYPDARSIYFISISIKVLIKVNLQSFHMSKYLQDPGQSVYSLATIFQIVYMLNFMLNI